MAELFFVCDWVQQVLVVGSWSYILNTWKERKVILGGCPDCQLDGSSMVESESVWMSWRLNRVTEMYHKGSMDAIVKEEEAIVVCPLCLCLEWCTRV
jgi:hypothetical protein